MPMTVGQLTNDQLRKRILELNYQIDELTTAHKKRSSQQTAATIAFVVGLVLTVLYGLGLFIAIPALIAYFWHGHKLGEIEASIAKAKQYRLAYQGKMK